MTSLPPQESAQFARFTAENRLHDLATPLGADTLIVERFIGREALSTLTAWHLDCLSTGLHLPPSVCSASRPATGWLFRAKRRRSKHVRRNGQAAAHHHFSESNNRITA